MVVVLTGMKIGHYERKRRFDCTKVRLAWTRKQPADLSEAFSERSSIMHVSASRSQQPYLIHTSVDAALKSLFGSVDVLTSSPAVSDGDIAEILVVGTM